LIKNFIYLFLPCILGLYEAFVTKLVVTCHLTNYSVKLIMKIKETHETTQKTSEILMNEKSVHAPLRSNKKH